MADLHSLLERLARLHTNRAHAEGLRPPQMEVLDYLSRANRFSRTASAVKDYLGLTKGTVSQTIMALEKRGLLRKERDNVDKRTIHLSLTSLGQNALKDRAESVIDRALTTLKGDDARHLGVLLETVLLTALQNAGGRPFGFCKTCRYFQKDDPNGKPHLCGLLEVSLSTGDSQKICVEHEH